MPTFEGSQQLGSVLVELWETVLKDDATREEVRVSNLSVITSLREPELLVWVGHEGVFSGEAANKNAAIRLEMTADTAHDVYSKKLDLATALVAGSIRAKGPAMKLLQLGPLLGRVYGEYPAVCQRHGIPQ